MIVVETLELMGWFILTILRACEDGGNIEVTNANKQRYIGMYDWSEAIDTTSKLVPHNLLPTQALWQSTT